MFSSKGKRRSSLGGLLPKEGGASGSPFQILAGGGGGRDFLKENCDVTLLWEQNFLISSTFLDRDGHLHFQMMEEKYGLQFCCVQSSTGKSYKGIHNNFSVFFFFCHICNTMVC